ncbi:LOW QUALITY PROTEIN: hypothetical protein Cgig2_025915 [Carnegiea gigantea]|uniref:Uncharacterized protein n=1 Tax=Carnegiea gigantea TaxID=171969 RepID=A0A9Q1QCC6_9CARY|nr:LOW QUALITY PROTEIN: hypothetical protein Cgig2_025915 [Carnegiea gigantea]
MGVAKVQFSEFFVVFGLLLAEDFSNQANFMTMELNLIMAYLLFHNDHTHETYGIKSFILFLARKQRRGLCICIDLKTILENVKLIYLLERESGLGATLNWEDVLSLGEQQSATSVDVEEHLYTVATNLGITVVTSSQRPALIPFHLLELRLIDGEEVRLDP